MEKYYTRACNFFYGSISKKLVKKKTTLPLCGNTLISFKHVEVITREQKKVKSKIINIKDIKKLPRAIKNKVLNDIKNLSPNEWPKVTLEHIKKGGHYVFFKSDYDNSSFLTTNNFQTQFGRQVVYENEIKLDNIFNEKIKKIKSKNE